MAKQKARRRYTASAAAAPSPFEQARDELFQHVIRCGVIGADAEHQREWFDNTLDYLSDRFSELTDAEVDELRTLGERFAQPPKGKAPEAPAVPEAPEAPVEVEAEADATSAV